MKLLEQSDLKELNFTELSEDCLLSVNGGCGGGSLLHDIFWYWATDGRIPSKYWP